MKKVILGVAIAACLTGCLSTTGGETEYTIKPIETSGGKLVCCAATVYNTKDYQKLKFKFIQKADGSMELTLDEDGVSASTPMAVMSESNKNLSEAVKGLINIVK